MKPERLSRHAPEIFLAAFAWILIGAIWLPDTAIVRPDLVSYFPTVFHPPWEGPWDSRLTMGSPSAANPQSGGFYPPAWLLALDFHRWLPFFLWLHFSAAGIGTYHWLRRAGLGTAGATLAGVVYCGSGPTWSLISQLNLLPGHALLPWLLWSLHAHTDLPSRRSARAVGAACVAGTWMGGSPIGIPVIVIVCVLWCLFEERAKRWKAVLEFGLLGGLLCSVSLLPLVEILAFTTRNDGIHADQLFKLSTQVSEWYRLALPGWINDLPRVGLDYFATLFMGWLPLCLALLGARQSRQRGFLLSGLIVFALLATGDQNPLLVLLVETAPSLAILRFPEKLWMAGALFVAALCGSGLEYAKRSLPRWVPVALGLTALELVASAWAVDERVSISDSYGRSPVMSALLSDWNGSSLPRLWNESHELNHPRPPEQGRSFVEQEHFLAVPNTGVPHGIRHVFGQAAFFLRRPAYFILYAVTNRPIEERRALLSLAGANYWIVYDQGASAELTRDLGLRPVPPAPGTSTPIALLRDPRAFPEATWTPGVVLANSEIDGIRQLAAGAGARTTLLIRGDPGSESVKPDASLQPARPLPFREVGTSSYRVDYDTTRTGMVTIRQAWAPGWKYAIDDGPFNDAVLANFYQVGAPAPPGSHRIAFNYRPAGRGLGASLSLVALILIAIRSR